MLKEITISSFSEVRKIVSAAASCFSEINVHDKNGSIADAKSILCLMSLDFSAPVVLVSDDEAELNRVYFSVAQ